MKKQVTVSQANIACRQSLHTLIDVRTALECSKSMPLNAINIPLDDLNNLALEKLNKDGHYYVICQIGIRSKVAVEYLTHLGFKNIYDVKKGFSQWQYKELPTQAFNIDNHSLRYNRHHQLQGFGKQGQDKLNNAHVLLIGAGGLGSPSALYLAAAGVGQITIIDDDTVQLSNLQRQVIHTTKSLDKLKVESAKSQLTALNPEIKVNAIPQRLNYDNAESLISVVDVVIDGTDNLETRYLVNDICVKYKKPLVYAAVYQYEAQISVFDLRKSDSPCLRCLFPQTQGFEPENCSTIGVLGVVPGLAGIMQATETIKIIVGIGKTLQNKLLICNLLGNSFKTINYKKSKSCQH